MVSHYSIMAGLIFPYRFGSGLWVTIALISIFSQTVQFQIDQFTSYVLNLCYLFVIYESVLYLIYIISEINQHLIESSIFETDDNAEIIDILKEIANNSKKYN